MSEKVWQDLLEWLATFPGGSRAVRDVKLVETEGGRGLVATSDIRTSTLLIQVPGQALINKQTLRALYPISFFKTLTSTQWISLHLALQAYRDRHSFPPSSRDRFSTFLRTLPKEFPTVPLTWFVHSLSRSEQEKHFGLDESDPGTVTWSDGEIWKKLLKVIPKTLSARLENIQSRFLRDWKATRQTWNVLLGEERQADVLQFADFLLAWLCVNTRCVYYDQGLPTSENLTLVPVIDMINHKDNMKTTPVRTPNGMSFSSPTYGSSDPPLKKGSELFFSYGPHEDDFLLAEYGFSLGPNNAYNQVDISSYITAAFENDLLGEDKRAILEDCEFWGEMTLQSSPSPAHPSFRVIIALRLLHLICDSDVHRSISPWKHSRDGVIDIISSQNEEAVKSSVLEICDSLDTEVTIGSREFEIFVSQCDKRELEHHKTLVACIDIIRGLWEEEKRIVSEVVQSYCLSNIEDSM